VFDRVTLRVSDLGVAKDFCTTALATLGYDNAVEAVVRE
jgi:hypothetical protein